MSNLKLSFPNIILILTVCALFLSLISYIYTVKMTKNVSVTTTPLSNNSPQNVIKKADQGNSDYRYLQFSTYSGNQLIVTNSSGSKTGFDLQTGKYVEEIPDSDYVLDEYYGDPTGPGRPPATDGIRFLTLSKLSDGVYTLETISVDGKLHETSIYSSDREGRLTGVSVMPNSLNEIYLIRYDQETAGSVVNIISNKQ